MGTFSVDISKFINKTDQRANLILRKVAIDTYERVKLKTPVDTGQLRASWTVSLGGLPTSFNGSNTVIEMVEFGNNIYIATDKTYAPMLEYGLYPKPGGEKTIDGYSTQAPQGMVRITVKEMQAWLQQNLGRFE
ncbi:hypothetical protein A4G18_00435 [Pasteurellaceae bacterium Pebbles2]|nr:hypothetical protein [Pasteurellaceae bacterium Pebbles2]